MEIITATLPVGIVLKGRSYSYKIEKVLGQGSFGITYLAAVKMEGALGSIDAHVQVAIKEFFMQAINGRDGTSVTSGSKQGLYTDYKKKFIREAQNLSKLNHQNIIKVLESFEANNTIYFAMEYIDGGSLDDLINKKGRLSTNECVKFSREICDALKFMHANGMLHLDLKPANIMLRNGSAILIDFGLSKQYNEKGEPESSTTVGRGTPGYAPLEQADYRDGKGFPVTMDIYALGGTMFKMLTGHRAPEASYILNDGFPEEELTETDAPSWLSALVEKCMSPMRKSRYQTVDEVLCVLNKGNVPNDVINVNVISVVEPNHINGHEFVDLGLSVKWATCNIGAESPTGYGNYYAWGETSPKSEYTEKNCKTYGKNMGSIAGNSQYDAARANWGGSWRLPMKAEIEELVDKCKHVWTTQGGVSGYKVTGPNGNSIFLPAAGYRIGSSLNILVSSGYYWSSTPYEGNTNNAYYLNFDSRYFHRDWYNRDFGRSVRPVSE